MPKSYENTISPNLQSTADPLSDSLYALTNLAITASTDFCGIIVLPEVTENEIFYSRSQILRCGQKLPC